MSDDEQRPAGSECCLRLSTERVAVRPRGSAGTGRGRGRTRPSRARTRAGLRRRARRRDAPRRAVTALLDRDPRVVDTGHPPPELGEPECVSPFATREIERSTGAAGPRPRDQEAVRLRAPHELRLRVPPIPVLTLHAASPSGLRRLACVAMSVRAQSAAPTRYGIASPNRARERAAKHGAGHLAERPGAVHDPERETLCQADGLCSMRRKRHSGCVEAAEGESRGTDEKRDRDRLPRGCEPRRDDDRSRQCNANRKETASSVRDPAEEGAQRRLEQAGCEEDASRSRRPTSLASSSASGPRTISIPKRNAGSVFSHSPPRNRGSRSAPREACGRDLLSTGSLGARSRRSRARERNNGDRRERGARSDELGDAAEQRPEHGSEDRCAEAPSR